MFTEEYVSGTLLERIGDKIRGVAVPEKPKAPRATTTQSAELRGFLASMEHFRAELARIDELLAAAVRDDGIDELQPAHGILHQATFTTGDASIQNVRHLSLGLRALSGALSGAIDTLQETPK